MSFKSRKPHHCDIRKGSAQSAVQAKARPSSGQHATATIQEKQPAALKQQKILDSIEGSPLQKAQGKLSDFQKVGNSPPFSMNRNQPLQRREVNGNELGAFNTDEGEDKIFDSRVHKGKVFSAEKDIKTNNTQNAISGYINSIRGVGNTATGFDFLDKNITDFSSQMPNQHNWDQNRMGELRNRNVDTLLDIKDKDMDTLFGPPKTRTDVSNWFNLIYNSRDTFRNNKYIGLVDPFLLKLTLNSERNGDNDWEITTQFADSGIGYITEIQVGNVDLTGKIVDSGKFNSDKGKQVEEDDHFIFSSTHVQNVPLAGDNDLSSFGARANTLQAPEEGDQKGTYHLGLDALTWMAAEGARFVPVAELGGRASPDTQFIYKPKNKNWKGAKSVSLTWLMQNWGVHFGKKYGVTAEEISDVVAQQGQAISSKPGGVSYNLTKKQIMEGN